MFLIKPQKKSSFTVQRNAFLSILIAFCLFCLDIALQIVSGDKVLSKAVAIHVVCKALVF